MTTDIPAKMADMIVMDATADIEKIAASVDFIFCAVDMKKDEIKALEDALNKAKPAAVKGQFMKSVTLASTMGPGVKVNPVKLQK